MTEAELRNFQVINLSKNTYYAHKVHAKKTCSIRAITTDWPTCTCKMSWKSAKDMEFENSASAWREDSTASLRRSSLWVVESRISDAVLYWRKLKLLCMVWAFEMVWALSRKRWSELSRAYLRIEGPSKATQRVSHWGSFREENREENERVKIGLNKFLL